MLIIKIVATVFVLVIFGLILTIMGRAMRNRDLEWLLFTITTMLFEFAMMGLLLVLIWVPW